MEDMERKPEVPEQEDLKGKKMVDVGCGAGFPGVPVKIACPEVELTLLDSLGKRMNWLDEEWLLTE